MPSIEHVSLLLLAPVAGLVAWLAATRGRRRGRLAGLGAALSAALIVVALAGIFTSEGSALRVFLIDVSASARGLPADLLPQIRAAAARMERGNRVAVVAFGRDASVLLPPTLVAHLPAELPAPTGIDQDGTSLEAALETALALFPKGAAGDVVLITDGRENTGDVAVRAGAAGRPVHSLTLALAPEKDAWIEAVRAPPVVAAGQDVDFEVLAGATSPMHGKLVLILNGRELARPEPVDVVARRMVLARRVTVREPGLYTLTARLLCPGDNTSENDTVSAAIKVRGKLTVTFVSSGDERALADALAESQAITLRRMSPEALAATNREMLRSDVIVLADVPAEKLGAERVAWLRRFVRDAGRGLVVFGGRNSFGPGGYAETPLGGLLPVDADPERRAAKPTSVVIVADRSGSMAELIGGRQKIEFVREAVLRAGAEFGARTGDRADELSVVAFNQEPEVLLERERPATSGGAAALRSAAGKLFPSGRTTIGRALDAARSMLVGSQLRRHIILISDGQSQDKLDGAKLAAQMKAADVVLSILATQTTMNEGLMALRAAAEATEGRFVMLKTISELPAAMARETQRITDSLVREGEFVVERGPGASWPGEIPVPSRITGYVLTGARPGAPPLLVTGGTPILATWRRGLGRVVACTTSLDHWATEWREEASGFLQQLVLGAGAGDRQHAVTVRLVAERQQITVTADAAEPLDDATLAVSLFAPGGHVRKLEMRRIGRRRYECVTEVGRQGTYAARVSDTKTGDVVGEGHVTIGYSPEWRPGGDASAATRLSHVSGGKVLKGLGDLPPLEPSTAGGGAAHNLAYILLCLAAAAFLVSSLR